MKDIEYNTGWINELVDKRFEDLNWRFRMFEMDCSYRWICIENDYLRMRSVLGLVMVKSPFYKRGSLHNFLSDIVGVDYCDGYTAADWRRHYEIERLSNRI